jgi:hypothetical protein
MMMQTQDTMTFEKAVAVMDALLDTFADGQILKESIRALEYLKEVKERAAQLLILEEKHVQTAITMAWLGLRFPEDWDRVNRSVIGVRRCFEFIKELASSEGEEPVTESEQENQQ